MKSNLCLTFCQIDTVLTTVRLCSVVCYAELAVDSDVPDLYLDVSLQLANLLVEGYIE
jgi:hypothetical protein